MQWGSLRPLCVVARAVVCIVVCIVVCAVVCIVTCPLLGCTSLHAPQTKPRQDAAAENAAPDAADIAAIALDAQPVDAGAAAAWRDGAVAPADAAVPRDAEPLSDAAHPTSKYCGDALRDPVSEECDDGPGSAHDSCSPACRARAVAVADAPNADADGGAPSQVELSFGSGAHVTAGSDSALGVVYVETTDQARVRLQRYSADGQPGAAALDVSAGTTPVANPEPVLAALPNQRFVVAYTAASSGTPDIVMRLLGRSNDTLSAPQLAHPSSAGFQHQPDLLWTGHSLVVAWTDALDVKYRLFDAQLQPASAERLLSSSNVIASAVTLAPFGSAWAAAFRVNDAGQEHIQVIAGDLSWSTTPGEPGPSDSRPALAPLDAQHLLLVYVVGSDPALTGTPSVWRLRYSVLSVSEPGMVSSAAWQPSMEPFHSDLSLSQEHPGSVQIDGRVYVVWQSTNPAQDSRSLDVFVTPVEYDLARLALTQEPELVLPFGGSPAGAQRNPHIGQNQLFPDGAAISVWEDCPSTHDTTLMMDLRPAPFVMLGP